MYASEYDHNIEIVKLLLEHGADINLPDNYGHTALMMASLEGNTEIVRLLLDQGADVNVQDRFDDASE